MATRCTELIVHEDALRGAGVEGSPYRRVVQVFTKDGELLAERDPCLGNLLREFAAKMDNDEKSRFLKTIQHLP